MRRCLGVLLVSLLLLALAVPVFAKSITLSYWTHADRNREDLEKRLIEERRKPGCLHHPMTTGG